jgi:hypothetical protein
MEKRKRPSADEQLKRFDEMSRKLGCDEDDATFDKNLKKIASAKPVIHASDCAVHDAPAYEPGRCTCGAEAKAGR